MAAVELFTKAAEGSVRLTRGVVAATTRTRRGSKELNSKRARDGAIASRINSIPILSAATSLVAAGQATCRTRSSSETPEGDSNAATSSTCSRTLRRRRQPRRLSRLPQARWRSTRRDKVQSSSSHLTESTSWEVTTTTGSRRKPASTWL